VDGSLRGQAHLQAAHGPRADEGGAEAERRSPCPAHPLEPALFLEVGRRAARWLGGRRRVVLPRVRVARIRQGISRCASAAREGRGRDSSLFGRTVVVAGVDAQTYFPMTDNVAARLGANREYRWSTQYQVYDRRPLNARSRRHLALDPHPDAACVGSGARIKRHGGLGFRTLRWPSQPRARPRSVPGGTTAVSFDGPTEPTARLTRT
jgi:hypothetical protein